MDAYLGEVRLFCGTFAPNGWADCNGQILPISQYTALYSILGNTYGGSAPTTFALPNLNGRVPLHQGQGPGLSQRFVGETGGAPAVSLTADQMPMHTHVAQALDSPGASMTPTGAVWAKGPTVGRPPVETPEFAPAPSTPMHPMALAPAGGGQPHNNMQPFLALRFIICLDGEYPARP